MARACAPSSASIANQIRSCGYEEQRHADRCEPSGIACRAVVFGVTISAAKDHSKDQDRYTLKVPGGLAFSEFKGYENWEVIAASQHGETIAVIVGNPEIINAFKSGIPGNGKPFPDGSRMAKIHWNAKVNPGLPGSPADARESARCRFHGEGQQAVPRGPRVGLWRVRARSCFQHIQGRNTSDKPPQEHDAKCGVECHEAAQNRDYVFTQFMPK